MKRRIGQLATAGPLPLSASLICVIHSDVSAEDNRRVRTVPRAKFGCAGGLADKEVVS